jgi:hypothetical protein
LKQRQAQNAAAKLKPPLVYPAPGVLIWPLIFVQRNLKNDIGRRLVNGLGDVWSLSLLHGKFSAFANNLLRHSLFGP